MSVALSVGVKLTTHLHVVLKIKEYWTRTSTPLYVIPVVVLNVRKM
jgi:hypothetical protein